MDSELVAKWTTILTNLAVFVGLVFVGLEFRNNTRSVEADRIDGYVQGNLDIQTPQIESADLAEILYQSYADPESMSEVDLDRAQHWMTNNYSAFMRSHLAHRLGLIPEELYEMDRQAIGFQFSSDIGLELIEIFRSSGLRSEVWDIIAESAKQARAYCLNPSNRCIARYEALRGSGR